MTMSKVPRALLFDVFGTCVDWRGTVTSCLNDTAHLRLNDATASLPTTIRLRASDMTIEHWGDFAQQWRESYYRFTQSVAADPSLTWKTVDQHFHDSLKELLQNWQLENLYDEEQILALSLIWHRLEPWADSVEGMGNLNKSCSTATLSNGNIDLLKDLKAYSRIPFMHIFSAEDFGSYKPNPKIYLGAVNKLGVLPQECAMVAAHLNDLKAAKSCGLQTIYVERAKEESWSQEQADAARSEDFVDLWISIQQNGFIDVAKALENIV